MTTRRFAVIVLFLVLWAQACRTYPTPDLSGTWKVNPAKSQTSQGSKLPVRIMTIVVSGDTLRMRPSTDVGQFTFVVNGREHVETALDASGTIYTRAFWKEGSLFAEIIIRSHDGSEVIHTRDRWTLSSDGNQLTDQGYGPHVLGTVVYDRQ